MVGALAVTAVASMVLAAVGGPVQRLVDAPPLPASALSVAATLLAVAAGAALVAWAPRVPPPLARAARRQLYGNEALRFAAQLPVLLAARWAERIERVAIDAAVEGVGRSAGRLARAANWVERHGIDAAVDGAAHATGRAGGALRRLQSGRLYEYLRSAMLGAAAIAVLIALTTLT
jgi:hypothetical protein